MKTAAKLKFFADGKKLSPKKQMVSVLFGENGYICVTTTFNESFMKKYACDVCGWEYDPEVGDPDNGIQPGISFEDLPEDFVCPICGVGKDQFSEQ